MSNSLILHFSAKLKIMTVHRTVFLCILRVLFLFSYYLPSHMSYLDTQEVLPHYTGFLQCASHTRTFQSHICSTLITTWTLFNISCAVFRGTSNTCINEKESLIREPDTNQQIFIRNRNKFWRAAHAASTTFVTVKSIACSLSSPPCPPEFPAYWMWHQWFP